MKLTFPYEPLKVYEPFHASRESERLISGGFGSGKTYALCSDAIAFGLQVAGARTLITRKTVPELRDTTEPVFLESLPEGLLKHCTISRTGGHMSSLIFPNGSEYLFRSIDDWQKHKSMNLARIYWDELSEFDEETYNGMRGRLRQVEPTVQARDAGYRHNIAEAHRGTAAATNPDGHSWIWRRWVAPDATHPDAHWIASSLDNPYLPMDYLHGLLAMPDVWVRRYVLASWDEFAGAIFPEWRYESHIWREALPLNDAVPVWMAYDPGTRHPTGVLWVVLHERRLIAVAEQLAAERSVDEWVKVVRRVETNLPRVRWRVADPSIRVRDRGSMMSLEQQLGRQGLRFSLGPRHHKDRIPMLQQLVHQRRFMGSNSTPQFNREMMDYRWEDLTPTQRRKYGGNEHYGPERPRTVDDDLVDCAQYLSSRLVRPLRSGAVQDESEPTSHQQLSADIHESLRKQRGRSSALPYDHALGGVPV